MQAIAPGSTIVLFGGSLTQDAKINLFAFAGHENARIQSFFSFASGTPESFGQDLSLLASLVATKELTPEIGSEEDWHKVQDVATQLRNRRVNGKAVFHIV